MLVPVLAISLVVIVTVIALAPALRSIGLLPQTSLAPEGIRVADLVARGRSPYQSLIQQWRPSDEQAVQEALAATRLEDLSGRLVDELSGGQRQRVWIAMLLAQQIPFMLLDEPTTFLDIAHQYELMELLRGLHGEGKTVVTVLHDLNQVAMLDAHDLDRRWERLETPSGQVDVVLDELLPRVRSEWPVSARGEDTVVSDQSLGGIAAHWTIALSAGEVGNAIAQSPSLSRFDIAEALLGAAGWHSIRMHAGSFEGDMLASAEELAERLAHDPRPVALESATGGHDWAVWRTDLLRALAAHPWA